MSKGVGREIVGIIPILIFAVVVLILYFVFGVNLVEAIINSIKSIIKIVEVK